MTMTYQPKLGELSNISADKTKVIKDTIISCMKAYGEKQNIQKLYEDNDSIYTTNLDTMIRLSDNGEIEISQEEGDKKKIDKTRSKLLKMVKGLELI